MTLKFKHASQRVRLIYGDGDGLSHTDLVSQNQTKMFAVIGPFEGHSDKADLQHMIETLLRGYNTEVK